MTEPIPVAADGPPSLIAPAAGSALEAEVALDMVRRGLYVLPVAVGLVWLLFGSHNAWSVAFGGALVMFNFILSAYLLAGAARISLSLIGSAALGGYALRLALIFLAVWLVKDTSWVRMIPLGLTIVATHLGLLVWELKYISASFAHPGLKPTTTRTGDRPTNRRRTKPAAGYRPKSMFDAERLGGGPPRTTDRQTS